MNPRIRLSCAIVMVAFLLCGFIYVSQHVEAQGGSSLSLISSNAAGTASGNNSSNNTRSSADGRFVVFLSNATNLTNIPDNNGVTDVFVRDLTTGVNTLVSINSAGTASGNSPSPYSTGASNPSISADGRYVAFDSLSSDLVAGIDTNSRRDVFVRDLVAQTTTLVSINPAGTTSGNGDSYNPVISADGSTIAFVSFATNLTGTADSNSYTDVFVRNLNTGTTVLASVNSAGTSAGNSNSSFSSNSYNPVTPSLSDDGRYVGFISNASNLTAISDTNNGGDGFVRDLTAGVTYLISINSAGTGSGSGSSSGCCNDLVYNLSISGNGQFVVFTSSFSNLVANDNNPYTDVFVRDLAGGKTSLLSINNTGTGSGNNSSANPNITPDGRFVVFDSYASNLVAADTNSNNYNSSSDVFIRDLTAQTTTLVSVNQTGTNSGNNGSSNPSISADGRFVAFLSSANDLAGNSTSYYSTPRSVFVRDVQANVTAWASYNDIGAVGPNSDSNNASISRNGQRVTFDSSASNLVSNDFNGLTDVFAYNVNQTLPLTVSINDAVITEGNAGTGTATFTVRLSAPSDNTVTVNYASADATALGGFDYQSVSGTLTFSPGTTTQTINVAINGDQFDEADETFNITLSNPVGATLGDGVGTCLIVDNDPLPIISINDASVAEGDTGTRNAVFQLSLSAPSGRPVTLQYSASDGTAASGYDYSQQYSNTVTFAPGMTTATINVAVNGDTLREGDEIFFLNFSNPVNATLSDNQAVGTIIDEPTDTGVPLITINDSSAGEGYTTSANFYVTLSAPVNQTITVSYATADNTATAGSDYTATSGTLTFAPGQTSSLQQSLYVPIINDSVIEPQENFYVNLSNPTNALIARGQAICTINDDDRQGEFNFYSSPYNGYRISENGGAISLTVQRGYNTVGTSTVHYATSNGTATPGSDYTAASGTLTFPDGVSQQTITIPILDDNVLENSESFNVTLSSPTGATLGYSATASVTIVDNDAGSGSVIISEFRFRGSAGTQDEFIELYNNTDYNITVSTSDGSRGWTVAALSDTGTSASPRFTIPNDTVIPARGHYLGTYASNDYYDINQYSLSNYGGSINRANGNQTYQTYTAENGGIALFRTANLANLTIANRLDAVGFKDMTSPVADLYREGMGLTYTDTGDAEMSYIRRLKNMTPQDTGDNAADFVLVSTTGGMFGNIQSTLGAPGPENLSSPIRRDSQIPASYVDPLTCGACAPNRVVAGTGSSRTLTIRRHFVNGTGQYVSRLRFRVIDITTLGSEVSDPPQAELRLANASNEPVSTSIGIVNVIGATLEQPPTQAMGGGLNSSLTVALPYSLNPGVGVDVQFLMNLVQGGRFRFYVSVEALP
jgi:Tol biopolymer transport system component